MIKKQNQRLLKIIVPVFATLAGVIAYIAFKTKKVPTPIVQWKEFDDPGAVPLDAVFCNGLEGVYRIVDGQDFFGERAVLKCSYTVEGRDTVYQLSFFCENNGSYLVCEARRKDDQVLMKGSWRQLKNRQLGTVKLQVSSADGSPGFQDNGSGRAMNSLAIHGYFGEKDKAPLKPVSFRYERPLKQKNDFAIIGHRGGARNVDFLPVSENSLEMFKMAAQLGANGVEIDVRLSKEGVPVIFHDSFLSLHTVKGKAFSPSLADHTLSELKALELKKGGSIATLEEALATILYQTPLEIIWLDIKYSGNQEPVRRLQQEYLHKAENARRKLNIYMGLPSEKILKDFQQLADHKKLPSLVELEPEFVEKVEAAVWAPQYTKGLQKEAVAEMHRKGKKVFVWSLDNKAMVDFYMNEGRFDGIVTNEPPVVAYYYYATDEDKVSAQ
jgi:glycerophosphoryl diester phosphodiesterase